MARPYHSPGSVGAALGIANAMVTAVTTGAQKEQPEVIGFCQSFLSSWLPPSPRGVMGTSPNSSSLCCPCEFVIPVLYLFPK